MKKAKQEITVGAKFGKLTIILFDYWHQEKLCVCQCECLRIVRTSEAELGDGKTCCLDCEGQILADNFHSGDVVLYKIQFNEIPFEAQLIVEEVISNGKFTTLKVEYCGHLYNCRPSDVASLGVRF